MNDEKNVEVTINLSSNSTFDQKSLLNRCICIFRRDIPSFLIFNSVTYIVVNI